MATEYKTKIRWRKRGEHEVREVVVNNWEVSEQVSWLRNHETQVGVNPKTNQPIYEITKRGSADYFHCEPVATVV